MRALLGVYAAAWLVWTALLVSSFDHPRSRREPWRAAIGVPLAAFLAFAWPLMLLAIFGPDLTRVVGRALWR